jgi:ubiquinone/menaquinone biosynthesis C-methylase UbiE
MSFYEEKILPHCIDRACSMPLIMKQRSRIVPRARGRVLEVGMGSGTNLQFYDPERVELVYGLEPSAGMRRKAAKNLEQAPVPVEWLDLPGEEVPLADDSVDTVLLTFTLCSIADWRGALAEMHRVLKPDGVLLFCEHGRAPEAGVQRWQDRLTPVWKRIAGGCHLNRPMNELITEGGFRITELEAEYLDQTPKFVGYIYSGEAVPG